MQTGPEYGSRVKTGSRLSFFAVISLAAPCALAALAMPSCGGDGFTSREESLGGGGGESSAGASSGGRSNSEAGDGNAPGESGSGGVEVGGTSGQGQAGDGSGGVNSGGSPEATGGMSGTTQGGTGGGGTGGETGGGGGSPATGVKAFDDFVASAEGWTVTGDDTTKTVKYSSTGGKPNGSISAEEATTGTLFFTAPQKYLGNVSAYYGGQFRFDLKAGPTNGDFFAYADVELTSNLVTLAYDCTPNPTTA